nr:hypothetical protein [Tanacetum cinerariifolium]
NSFSYSLILMTSFGYRSNPLYAIKECSSCGTLYTRDCGCSKGKVKDKILIPKPPKNCARCTRCGCLVDGPNCQGCALLRQELEENLVKHSLDFQNSSEPSNASTNIVNAPREPYVVKQDNGSFVDKIIFDLNKAPDSPHLNTISANQFHCFHCKDVLRDGEACKRCTCKSCGKDAHIGYNCPSKVPVISIPEPCNNQTIDELPQTLPMFHPTFQSEAESPFTLDSTPTYVDEPPNIFNPPPQSFISDSLDDNIISGLPSFFAITPDEPVLSTEEPDNSLSMGDEHLDTIPATESDEFIKSGVETLIPIPSESEGIPEHMCDVPSHDNSPPLDVSKDQFKDFSESNEEFSSIDDDSFSIDNIDYVEASPPDSELVSSEVMEFVIPKVGGIDDDILLTIKDDILREKLLNVNLLIAKSEALNAHPTPSSDCKTKSSSISLNSLLEETNT